MKTLGNVLWFILIGWWEGLVWILCGAIMCVLIITIPIGKQCFKVAGFVFWPFGKSIAPTAKGGSTFLDVIWLLLGGLETAIITWLLGCVFYITIIGIPFGKQCFKLAKLALAPSGYKVLSAEETALAARQAAVAQ